jgi:CTP synthase (UTP-ammonia lyase)
MRRVVVNLLIDYPPDHPYHRASVIALEDASDQTDVAADVRIVPTDTIESADRLTTQGSAVFVGPGTPYRNPEAANAVIRSARERGVPLVAT